MKTSAKPLWALAILAGVLTLLVGCSWDYVGPDGVLHEDPGPLFSWSSQEGLKIDFESDQRYVLPRW